MCSYAVNAQWFAIQIYSEQSNVGFASIELPRQIVPASECATKSRAPNILSVVLSAGRRVRHYWLALLASVKE